MACQHKLEILQVVREIIQHFLCNFPKELTLTGIARSGDPNFWPHLARPHERSTQIMLIMAHSATHLSHLATVNDRYLALCSLYGAIALACNSFVSLWLYLN